MKGYWTILDKFCLISFTFREIWGSPLGQQISALLVFGQEWLKIFILEIYLSTFVFGIVQVFGHNMKWTDRQKRRNSCSDAKFCYTTNIIRIEFASKAFSFVLFYWSFHNCRGGIKCIFWNRMGYFYIENYNNFEGQKRILNL